MSIRLTNKDRLALLSDLATMLQAGIPIVEVIDSMHDDSQGKPKKVLEVIKQAIYQGHQLSDSLRSMPHAFDTITVNLVAAAEQSGTLETTLQDLAESTQKSITFSDQVRSAFVYPIFIVIVFVGVIGAMLGFVIPRIATVFETMGSTLPPATVWLIDTSKFFVANYLYIGLGVVLVITLIGFAYYFQKRFFINTLLSLPFFKTMGRQIDLARFSRSMALLLKAGIPIPEALELTRSLVNKREIARVIEDTKRSVDAGKTISEGLHKHRRIVSPTTIRMVDTGEKSGTLDNAMQQLADYFEVRVTRSLKTVVTLLEPTLLLVIGALVGGMMIAIVGPMYSIISNVGS